MAHVIGFKVEVIEPGRRDEIMRALASLIQAFEGADAGELTYTREVKTSHGKRKITDTIKIEPGELIDFNEIEDSMGLTTIRPLELLWSKTNTA